MELKKNCFIKDEPYNISLNYDKNNMIVIKNQKNQSINNIKYIIWDSKSYPEHLSTHNSYHISHFGPKSVNDKIRDNAREYISKISNSILNTTKKTVYQSLIHKNVSAWWFIEIAFQEPMYLILRQKEALKRFKNEKKNEMIFEDFFEPFKEKYINILPSIEYNLPVSKKNQYKKYIKQIFRNGVLKLYQFGQILVIPRKKVLSVIEFENLRRNYDFLTEDYFTVLSYAEGIFEILNSSIGENFECISKSNANFIQEAFKWNFIKRNLPVKNIKPLNKYDEIIIEEIYELFDKNIADYLSLNTIKEIYQHKLAEYDMYYDLLKQIKPETVFIYNWEGVFRPLASAARAHKIYFAGIQQALGPYHHALDHKESGYWTLQNNNKTGFCIPDKLYVWSEFHLNNFLSFEYPKTALEIRGYARLDRHNKIKSLKNIESRKKICELLKLDPEKKYLLLTAQVEVLDTALILKENYMQTMNVLLNFSNTNNFCIIIKPWASDNMEFLKSFAGGVSDKIFFAPQDLIIHNADLLSITEVCVGTFSSIMGEATLLNNLCFLLNYPESRYYFEMSYVENYRDMVVFNDSPEELEKNMIEYLSDQKKMFNFKNKALNKFQYLFGNTDGKSSKKIVDSILNR